ncbi:MAG: hypothetical protein WBN96_04175 [Gammaproteobacteria bacterium]
MLDDSASIAGKNIMQSTDIKSAAHQLIDLLPEGSTWNDAIHEMVVRREIELGLEDSNADRTTAVEDVRKEYGLDK